MAEMMKDEDVQRAWLRVRAHDALDALIEAEAALPRLENVPEQGIIYHGPSGEMFIYRASSMSHLRDLLIAIDAAAEARR